MIWNDFHYDSKALGIRASVYVLLPEPWELGKELLPTLYLLHGLSDDHTMWLRQTRIEQFASEYHMAVVMPAVNRSFYTDMAYGAKYFTFVSEELPRVMEAVFPLSHKREERFAAGLSMGGYGAMKLGLRLPEQYAAVASLSGAVEVEMLFAGGDHTIEFMREAEAIFGSESALNASDDSLHVLAQKLIRSGAKAPRIYMACGESDFLYETNNDFYARYGEKLNIEYHTHPDEAHTWSYWDARIGEVIPWLGLPKIGDRS